MPGLRTTTLLGIAACGAAALSGPASALARRPTARALQRPAVLWLRAGSSASMSAPSGPPDAKLAALRAEMARAGVGALVVPSGDAHLSEYVHPHYDRRAFVSGFTGSAGTALVTPDRALLWTDGRYFLQAERELGSEWSLMRAGEPEVPTLHQWVAEHLPAGTGMGIDPHVFSVDEAQALETALAGAGRQLSMIPMVGPNLVDTVWGDGSSSWPRAPPPTGHALSVPLHHSGLGRVAKISSAAAAARAQGAGALLVCMLDEVGWLLNLRGRDVPHCPVLQGFVLVHTGGEGQREAGGGRAGAAGDGSARSGAPPPPAAFPAATLFVDETKISPELAAELAADGVEVLSYGQIQPAIEAVVAAGKGVMLDPNKVTYALRRAAGSSAIERPSPLSLPKSIKNEAEIEGMVAAHRADGAALATFFCWLERRVCTEGGTVDEKEIAKRVAAARASFGAFDLSFPTIAGVGANGAIIHYDCSKADNPAVFDGSQMLLLDSGGQYPGGTTDVTRTIHMGTPTPWQRQMFTRVLKGNIGLDSTLFPDGTPGMAIDAFARAALWQVGLDYLHGTGHGVGAGLNVHEGPQSISARYGNQVGLRAGMICSNEPGYYEQGAFGIRIENLLIIRKRQTAHAMPGRNFLGFDQLTHVPIQKSLMDVSLLTAAEVEWINSYHGRVWAQVSPLLPEEDYSEARQWLRTATAPISSPLAEAAATLVPGPPVCATA